MWGIGVACSLLFLATVSSWAIEGKIGLRWRIFAGESEGVIRKEDAPARFWMLAGFLIAVGATSTIITGLRLSKIQREDEPRA